ncbi:MAG: discoidin domain-containing protein, partial [Planctomycetota bacterium]
MKMRLGTAAWAGTAVLVFFQVAGAAEPSGDVAERERPVRSLRQIEDDWLRQNVVRNLPAGHDLPAVTPEQDAPGACDGVRNGKYGFHTSRDSNPWWQVDLLTSLPLEEVLIFNRCDGSQDRAFQLAVLLSDDAESWKPVYRHDGTPFFGHADNKPLSVDLRGARARYLRVQLPGETYLHLDEVEIYQPDGRRNIALRKPATQSSASAWSTKSTMISVANDAGPERAAMPGGEPPYPIRTVIDRGLRLAESLPR